MKRRARASTPFPTGFISVPYNDIDAVKRAADADRRVRAVWLEVLQGEGGIYVADLDYVKALRQLCDQRGLLLMIDEVQSGIGRTGKWFAHQWAGIKPDVMTLAKGLGSGVPVGACVAAGPAAGVFGPGNHGTTFGGGPLAMRAGIETLEIIEKDGLMANAVAQGERIVGGLKRKLAGVSGVVQIRGMGLMIGIELDRPCGELVRQALAAGLLINVTHDTVIRMLPPLILSAEEADLIVERLAPLISAFLRSQTEVTSNTTAKGGLSCMAGGIRHFLQFADFDRTELEWVFERSRIIKDRFKRYQFYQPLADRTLAMVFEKASTRTRVSFEAGMYQMGGSVIHITTGDSQLGRAEPIEDTARVISRMVDIVMIRTFEQAKLERFAAHSRVPVINGLTNEYHPCQILADIFTFIEHRGPIAGRTVAWIGDANNMAYTWLQAAQSSGVSAQRVDTAGLCARPVAGHRRRASASLRRPDGGCARRRAW